MKQVLGIVCCSLVLAPSLCRAQSLFDGTWRPDPQKADPHQPPDELVLMNGQYECQSCEPPYKIAMDGRDHAVTGSRYYDSLSILIVDARTVIKTAKKSGTTVASIKEVVSPDGKRRTQLQTVTGIAPRSFVFASTYSRVATGPSGSHSLSGTWRGIQGDLVNHEEDTTYKISHNMLSMSDHFGRSFSAKLDGTEAPFKGDPEFSGVSLRMINSHTIQETDLKDGKAVKIATWTVRPDGKTMHVRFDDTKGHIQEQDGHRVP